AVRRVHVSLLLPGPRQRSEQQGVARIVAQRRGQSSFRCAEIALLALAIGKPDGMRDAEVAERAALCRRQRGIPIEAAQDLSEEGVVFRVEQGRGELQT